ncbi:MAG TPA: energy transducer TonB [Pyrinomonadaceae bacterium]
MKKILFLTAAVCLLAIASFAQTKTDFSGRWELNTVESKLDERMRVESMTLNVAQTDRELKVETTTKRTVSADSSGGGGMNRGGMSGGNQTVTYSLVPGTAVKGETVSSGGGATSAETNMLKASLESDGRLKLHSVRSFDGQMGKVTITVDEVWELTNEGQTLKINRTMESPRGTNTSEMIFAKKDAAQAQADKAQMTDTSKSSLPVPKVISGGVLNGKAKTLVKPAYPEAAKAVRASGAVNIQVTIDEEGNVISATAVSGHPLLRAASEEAARASKFSPTMLEGVPVKVTGIIVYNFTP